MSDIIKHECGIAFIRLLKPLSFYKKKYGTPTYGLNKLYILMEKQRNRGQDGAGLATIKLDWPSGKKYINIYKTTVSEPISAIYEKIHTGISNAQNADPSKAQDCDYLKEKVDFVGEILLGHLRYATHGDYEATNCHPIVRENNWMTRNLVLAGNFNLTNTDELLQHLIKLGQHPREESDTVTVLEKIGHFLDFENQCLFDKYKKQGHSNKKISGLIAKNLNVQNILSRSAKDFDGGYVLAGLIGHGDAFVLRDPAGIRTAYYYQDNEIIVVTSERPPIQSAFNVNLKKIQEIVPGHALIIKKNGKTDMVSCIKPVKKKSCSFERIYFSRGNDQDIYNERKKLGYLLVPFVLEAINYDLKNTVFSFIPNTAEVAFYGMIKGLEEYLNTVKNKKIKELGNKIDNKQLNELLSIRPRIEKIAIKDVKLRTFITKDTERNELVSHVYDVTYGAVRKGVDNLVVIDDSIVRGTTLKESIIRILDTLNPKKIIIVSSAPQIRYPDCYGIDMSKLADFVAFKAAISLLKEKKKDKLIDIIYKQAKKQQSLPTVKSTNFVKKIYEPFSYEEVSNKIAELLKPKKLNAELKIIYQSIDNLHKACPNHKGDWYFSGDYPTPGGNKVVNNSFINFAEQVDKRAY